MKRPASSIQNLIRHTTHKEKLKNRFIIEPLAEAILFCGKQCIALRGHRYDSGVDIHTNRGNFLALIDFIVKSGNVTLVKEAARNVIYTNHNYSK